MRVLITGAGGFVGHHLARLLNSQQKGLELHGTVRRQPTISQEPAITYHSLDLRDEDAVHQLITTVQPESIYHLAAQAFVPRSFEAPWETLENNIRAQLNILQACLKANIQPRILVAGSGQIYGHVKPEELPLAEDTPPRPTSPYSVSKIAQDMLGWQYYKSHGLPIMLARPFNHIGPGQSERFVAAAFAMQIARIEVGQQESTLFIGNLEAQRDFTDVRDVARAYHLILEKGEPGIVYHIASGKTHSVQYLLDTLMSFTTTKITVKTDPNRLRPADSPIILGDATRLHEQTGWQPTIPIERSLEDILNDCRQRVKVRG